MSYKMVFVGASGHANLVLDELSAHPQVQLAAFAPSFPGEEMRRVAAVASEARGYDSWRGMLDAERPDIVVACGRNDMNGIIAADAARRGCHVISEKPAATTVDTLRDLRDAVARSGRLYGIMLNMRYDAPYWTAHELVQQGLIGEPYLLTAQKSYRWGNARPEWYADAAAYGSSITWIGIHAFDFARWVSGAEFTEVFAYHANLVRTERPGCQDVSTVIARLANGGSATFNIDYLRPEAAPTHGDDRLRVAGSRGVIEICDQGTRVHVITPERDVPAWPLIESQRSLFGDFVAALEGRGRLLVSPEEAFSITGFALRAEQAADGGRPVTL